MSDLSRYYNIDKKKYEEGIDINVDDDIEKIICQIVEKRKEKVPVVKKNQEVLDNIKNELQNFISSKKEFIGNFTGQDNEGTKLSASERNEIIGHINAITDEEINEIIKKIDVAKNKNDILLKRIDKDNICIAIAGGARNGKSTLIQTITGLDESTVPTSEEGFCTGARSTIENSEEFRVEVEFYSEEELLNNVIERYREFYKEYGAKEVRLNSLADIKTLYEFLKQKNLPEGSQYLKRLNEYAEKQDIYKVYLGRQTEVYHYDQKKEIRKFVSQISEDGDSKFYEFLAVKRARIYCPFAVTKVRKIVLVDTVGLGEASLGIEDDMLETVSKEADFIINLKQMSDMSTAILMISDYNYYDKIVQANGKIPPEKWCYWVFNRRQDRYKEGIFENRYYSELMLELEQKSIPSYPAGILNVDCSNKNEVMERLINPMLIHIVNNLEDIDRYQFLNVGDAIKQVYIPFSKLMAKVKMVSVSEQKADEFFSFKFEESHEKLVYDLHEFCTAYKEEIQRIVPALEMIKITNEMVKCVPSINEITRKWQTVSKQSYLLTMNWGFDETIKRLERMLENKTKNYEEEIRNFKIKVVKEVLKASGLEKCIVVDYEDENVVAEVASELFSSFERCKNLQEIFVGMQNFDIKDQLDMQKKLNKATQHYLNVNYNPDPDSGMFPRSWNKDNGAVELSRVLFNHITKIQTSFMMDADVLKLMPIKEMENKLTAFINDITNDENKEGWRMVYSANKDILWKEELEKLEAASNRIAQWSNLIANLKQTEENLSNIIEMMEK